MSFTLAHPSLYGDYLGPPIRTFLTGLMLLAGLILLAACTNLGGLFAARAADRSREVALRLAGRAFKLLAFGSAAGLLLGILASRVLAFIVCQATPPAIRWYWLVLS